MSDEAVVVSEDYPATRRAVFVAYTFYALPYLDYYEPGTPEEFPNSSAMIPMVLMTYEVGWETRFYRRVSGRRSERAGDALEGASRRKPGLHFLMRTHDFLM